MSKSKKNSKHRGKNKHKTKPTKTPTKKLLMLISILILVGVIFTGFLIYKAVKKPVIGLYALSQNIETAFKKQADKWIYPYKKEFKYIEINQELSTVEQLKLFKKCDLVFAHASLNTKNFAPHAQTTPQNLLGLMPSAMRKTTHNEQKNYALPILFDHFELAWHKKHLAQTGIEKPLSFAHLARAQEQSKNKTRYPFICAGADDFTLLGLISALTEAIEGKEAYQKIITETQTSKPEELLRNPHLQNTLHTLIEWRNTDFIHPEWFRMTQTDVHAFMENDYALFVAMYLSDHRKIEHKTIEKYDSIYFPSIDGRSTRAFIAPHYLALLPQKKKTNPFAQEFFENLISNATQTKLSNVTGLAPANAQCETPDRQASDVRLWLAASQEPLVPFSSSLYVDTTKTATFVAVIRNYIESGGK